MSEPVTALDHYRLLGRSGLRVSPLALGTMTFGTAWGWGAPEDVCHAMLDAYTAHGGNFVDTANNYTDGQSETIVGTWLAQSGQRDRMVLATKYTLTPADRRGDPNAGGNHRKSLTRNLEASLRRLQTDYLDVYYLHIWEYRTPVEEVLRALDDAVRAGKILYAAFSDTPAWKVAQAQTIADLRGWSPLIALQVEYSLMQRDIERELVPMAQELGLGVVPWGALHGGALTGKYNPLGDADAQAGRRGANNPLDDHKAAISTLVQQIAHDHGHTPSQVALAWMLAQPGITSPILGARTLAQLEDNLAALTVTLPAAAHAQLDAATRPTLGVPHDMIASPMAAQLVSAGATIEAHPPAPHAPR